MCIYIYIYIYIYLYIYICIYVYACLCVKYQGADVFTTVAIRTTVEGPIKIEAISEDTVPVANGRTMERIFHRPLSRVGLELGLFFYFLFYFYFLFLLPIDRLSRVSLKLGLTPNKLVYLFNRNSAPQYIYYVKRAFENRWPHVQAFSTSSRFRAALFFFLEALLF